MNNIATVNEIKAFQTEANKLLTALMSIEEDLKIMEMLFDSKFDTLILNYKNVLHHLYYDHFEKNKKKSQKTKLKWRKQEQITKKARTNQQKIRINNDKTSKSKQNIRLFRKNQISEIKKITSNALYDSLDSHLLAEILPEIVFKHFLIFYDELSYAINERIKETHQLYININLKFKWLFDFGMIPYKNERKNVNLENSKYRDFHYFRNKLEKKLAKYFDIDVVRIRTILYNCNPNNKNSHLNHIIQYYHFIFHYRKICCVSKINIVKHLEEWYYGKKLIGQEAAINISFCKYTDYFNVHPPDLYDYHNTLSQTSVFTKTFTLSKTRFSVYEKLLKKYKCWEDFPPETKKEDKSLFENYVFSSPLEIELNLRREFFKFISCEQETIYIQYSDMLKKIKLFIQKCF